MAFIAFKEHSGSLDDRVARSSGSPEWSEEFSVGVGEMDRQHRELFEAVNALHLANGQAFDDSVMGDLLMKILNLTRAHFASEEKLMTHTGYPGIALHVLKHEDLLIQLNALVSRFKQGRRNLNEYTLQFMNDWLNKHIKSEDRSFALWLNDQAMR